MREHDKTPEEQLSEAEIGNLPEKIIQNNDSKDDARSQKKHGGTDQEDTRNVLQRARFKEQTELNNKITEIKNTLE